MVPHYRGRQRGRHHRGPLHPNDQLGDARRGDLVAHRARRGSRLNASASSQVHELAIDVSDPGDALLPS